ncbi:uncharacterized protein [Spinacia oleracea]|uniref:FRIGIDA-like protein n=1 Tax=Spinacia oleracea TaxID=3562 RepID=A0A9R0JLA8_SPIOL|nr:uncharacterized protein LOC110778696 [Spinacia oleracea]
MEEQASTASTVITAADARLVMKKLGDFFDNSYSTVFAIPSLSEQWSTLQSSFAMVEASMASREKELESKKRENITDVVGRVKRLRETVELREKVVAKRENSVKQSYEVIDLKKRKALEKRNASEGLRKKFGEVEGKENQERYRVLETREKQFAARCNVDEVSQLREKEMMEREEGLKLKERRIQERIQELEVKERKVDEGFLACRKELELKKDELIEKRRGLVLVEKKLNEQCCELQLKAGELLEERKVLVLKGKELAEMCKRGDLMKHDVEEMNDRYGAVELKENELSEGLRLLESKEKELNVRREKLESTEKDVDECFMAVTLKEKELNESVRALELKQKEINESRKEVELMKMEVDGRCRVVELKEKEMNDRLHGLELKEKQLNESYERLELAQKGVDECLRAGNSKEKKMNESVRALELKEKEIDEILKELDLMKGVDERCLAVEEKEKELNDRFAELDFREQQIDVCREIQESKEKHIDKCYRNLELKEERIYERSQSLKLKERHIHKRSRNLELKEKRIDERSRSLELKEKRIDERSQSLELKEKHILKRYQSLESKDKPMKIKLQEKKLNEALQALEPKEKHIDKHYQRLELKKKQTSEQCRVVELKEKQLDKALQAVEPVKKQITEKYRDLELKKEINDRCEDMEVKETQIRCCHRSLDLREQEINEFRRVHKSEDKQISETFRSTESKEKKMNQIKEGVEFKEKQSNGTSIELAEAKNGDSTCAEVETKEPLPGTFLVTRAVASSSVRLADDIQLLCKNMDMKGVRSYLIQHVKEYDILEDKILDSLRLASDPAKLVLDVFQSFYDLELEEFPVKDLTAGCIFLLVQLMKLRSDISSRVKDEASEFVGNWKLMLKQDNTPLENFGFLQFLASYKLAESYHADDLFSLFITIFDERKVYQPEKNPHLCDALGLTRKIPDLVQSLNLRDKQLQAVRYICALHMVDAFPIGSLLRTHLVNIQKQVEEITEQGSITAQDDASDMELTALKEVVKCISYFKLESHYSPVSLEKRIKQLEEERKERKSSAHSFAIKKCSDLEKIGMEEMAETSNIRDLPSEKKRPAKSVESPKQEKRPRVVAHHELTPDCPSFLRPPAHFWPYGYPVWQHQPPPVTWPMPSYDYVASSAVAGVAYDTRTAGFGVAATYPVGAPTLVSNARNQAYREARGHDSIVIPTNFNRS